jgi:uncharacterized membrane protein
LQSQGNSTRSGKRQCANSASPIGIPVLYAALKAIHLLCIVAWLGGMFFALACLHPAAVEQLEPPERIRLMHATLRRFLDVLMAAIVLTLASGAALIGLAVRDRASAALPFAMPLDWYAMVGLFAVMALVFVRVRWVLFPRATRGLQAQAWPDAAAALGAIRRAVMLNLTLGVVVVVVVRLGTAA